MRASRSRARRRWARTDPVASESRPPHLGICHTFDHGEVEHGTLAWRQPRQEGRDVEIRRGISAHGPVADVIERRPEPPESPPSQATAEDDRRHPAVEARGIVERGEGAPPGDQRLLDDILGVGIADDRAGEPHQTVPARLDGRSVRVGAAGPCLAHDVREVVPHDHESPSVGGFVYVARALHEGARPAARSELQYPGIGGGMTSRSSASSAVAPSSPLGKYSPVKPPEAVRRRDVLRQAATPAEDAADDQEDRRRGLRDRCARRAPRGRSVAFTWARRIRITGRDSGGGCGWVRSQPRDVARAGESGNWRSWSTSRGRSKSRSSSTATRTARASDSCSRRSPGSSERTKRKRPGRRVTDVPWCESPWCAEERRHAATFARIIERLTASSPAQRQSQSPEDRDLVGSRMPIRLVISREAAEWNSSSTYAVMAAHATGDLHHLFRNVARDEIKHLSILGAADRYLFGPRPWRRFADVVRESLDEYRAHKRRRSAGDLMGTNPLTAVEVVFAHVLAESAIRRWTQDPSAAHARVDLRRPFSTCPNWRRSRCRRSAARRARPRFSRARRRARACRGGRRAGSDARWNSAPSRRLSLEPSRRWSASEFGAFRGAETPGSRADREVRKRIRRCGGHDPAGLPDRSPPRPPDPQQPARAGATPAVAKDTPAQTPVLPHRATPESRCYSEARAAPALGQVRCRSLDHPGGCTPFSSPAPAITCSSGIPLHSGRSRLG